MWWDSGEFCEHSIEKKIVTSIKWAAKQRTFFTIFATVKLEPKYIGYLTKFGVSCKLYKFEPQTAFCVKAASKFYKKIR